MSEGCYRCVCAFCQRPCPLRRFAPRPGCGSQRLPRCCSHPAGRCPNSSSLFPPLAAVVAVAPKGGALPVILALRQTQLAVHDELCGGFDVGAAVGEGLGVVGRELAQHPVGQIVVRAGLCAHADADAGEVLAAEAGDDALEAVVAARRAGGPDAQLAGVLGDVVAQDDDVVRRDLEEARQRADGVAREIHISQGLQEHDLVAVYLALPPQALKLGLGDGDAPLAGQIVQRGKACVVTGAVVFRLRISEAGNEPDVIGVHMIYSAFFTLDLFSNNMLL